MPLKPTGFLVCSWEARFPPEKNSYLKMQGRQIWIYKMKFVIIKTTFENKKDAEDIAKKIIDARIGACVQISEVESYYCWNEKVENAKEYKIEIKTTKERYKEVEELILKNHKYDIPEIVSYELTDGSKEYFDWINGEVNK